MVNVSLSAMAVKKQKQSYNSKKEFGIALPRQAETRNDLIRHTIYDIRHTRGKDA